MITKQQVLDNLDEVKKYVAEADAKKEEKVVGIAIKNRFTGEIIFQSTKMKKKNGEEDDPQLDEREQTLADSVTEDL